MEKKYNTSKLKVCKTCGGRGEIWVQNTYPRHGSDDGSGNYKTCEVCMGERIVRVTKEIKLTIEPFIINHYKIS